MPIRNPSEWGGDQLGHAAVAVNRSSEPFIALTRKYTRRLPYGELALATSRLR